MQKRLPGSGMLHVASLMHGVGGVCVGRGQGAFPHAQLDISNPWCKMASCCENLLAKLHLRVLLTLHVAWGRSLCEFAWAAMTNTTA